MLSMDRQLSTASLVLWGPGAEKGGRRIHRASGNTDVEV